MPLTPHDNSLLILPGPVSSPFVSACRMSPSASSHPARFAANASACFFRKALTTLSCQPCARVHDVGCHVPVAPMMPVSIVVGRVFRCTVCLPLPQVRRCIRAPRIPLSAAAWVQGHRPGRARSGWRQPHPYRPGRQRRRHPRRRVGRRRPCTALPPSCSSTR